MNWIIPFDLREILESLDFEKKIASERLNIPFLAFKKSTVDETLFSGMISRFELLSDVTIYPNMSTNPYEIPSRLRPLAIFFKFRVGYTGMTG
jgi:hypothetical protein